MNIKRAIQDNEAARAQPAIEFTTCNMAKIITVYEKRKWPFAPVEMSYIRWLKISEALARLGHQVDIATNEPAGWGRSIRHPVSMASNLRRVPLSDVAWRDYDVVKTLFHRGFETLETYKALDHPFIISKLGSVVGPVEIEGIYFSEEIRKKLYSLQQKINRISKFVTLLSAPAKDLWLSCFGRAENILLVPGAADSSIPEPQSDPYPKESFKRCIFAGNIYIRQAQKEANRVLVEKLNLLGEMLIARKIRLYMIGTGYMNKLNREHVRYLGAVPYDCSWDFFRFADAGVVLAPGKFLHNNESTKIYHCLRVGLPVISERGFPNESLISESGLGYIAENGNMAEMADLVEQAIRKNDWDRNRAIRFILDRHTWDHRAAVYHRVIRNGC